MTEKKRKEIRSWLNERRSIVDKYANSIGATYAGDDMWTIRMDGEVKYVSFIFKGNEKSLGLLVNHAYLRGAQDALYGFGIMHE